MSKKLSVSAIVPVFNEEKNLKILTNRLKKGLNKVDAHYEIIFINDGSTDDSEKVLKEIYRKNNRVSLILFENNFGKTAALEAGVELARGEILVLLDSDLQHDPLEIPKLVKKVKDGFAVVTGWRTKRRDAFHRVLFSKVVNGSLFLLTGFRANDFYCGFKCYRRKLIKELGIHSDLFRFVAYLAFKKGYRVVEVPVTYHYRRHGRSQSGGKLFKRAIHDLLILLFVIKNLQKGQYKIKKKLIKRG